MVKLTTAQRWLRTIAWLRRNFSAQRPILVRSIILKKEHGYTEYDTMWKFFRIKIHRKQSFELRIDTLIHEWAHCLTWFGAEETTEHSAEWGLAYARIYRTFEEWNYGRKANIIGVIK